jgi:hypothetical protein
VDGGLGVLESGSHVGEELLRETDDSLVNVAENSLLNTLVLDNLTEDTPVTSSDDEDLLGVGVGVHGKVSDHLLVGELVSLSALDDVVENENVAVIGGLEDEDLIAGQHHILMQASRIEGNLRPGRGTSRGGGPSRP